MLGAMALRVSALVLGCAFASAAFSSSSCATSVASAAPSLGARASALPRDFDAGAPSTAWVPKPQSANEATVLIADAVEMLQRRDAGALPRFEALLRCDFLSERGRANLYWLSAEAARGVDDGKRREALAGYLVAASVLPSDVELRDKVGRARAMLLADQVQSRGLGDSPERPIVVDSVSDADILVAQLGCGARGQSPYIVRHGLITTAGDDDDGLAARRLLCTENGDELVLWFRVAP